MRAVRRHEQPRRPRQPDLVYRGMSPAEVTGGTDDRAVGAGAGRHGAQRDDRRRRRDQFQLRGAAPRLPEAVRPARADGEHAGGVRRQVTSTSSRRQRRARRPSSTRAASPAAATRGRASAAPAPLSRTRASRARATAAGAAADGAAGDLARRRARRGGWTVMANHGGATRTARAGGRAAHRGDVRPHAARL